MSVIAAKRWPRHNLPMARPRHRRPPPDQQAPARRVAFVDELPRTPTGKVLKRLLL